MASNGKLEDRAAGHSYLVHRSIIVDLGGSRAERDYDCGLWPCGSSVCIYKDNLSAGTMHVHLFNKSQPRAYIVEASKCTYSQYHLSYFSHNIDHLSSE